MLWYVKQASTCILLGPDPLKEYSSPSLHSWGGVDFTPCVWVALHRPGWGNYNKKKQKKKTVRWQEMCTH